MKFFSFYLVNSISVSHFNPCLEEEMLPFQGQIIEAGQKEFKEYIPEKNVFILVSSLSQN